MHRWGCMGIPMPGGGGGACVSSSPGGGGQWYPIPNGGGSTLILGRVGVPLADGDPHPSLVDKYARTRTSNNTYLSLVAFISKCVEEISFESIHVFSSLRFESSDFSICYAEILQSDGFQGLWAEQVDQGGYFTVRYVGW